MSRSELLGRLDVLLGGRVAERLVFGEVSTGAANDLQRATDLARAMLTQYGMGETLGPVTYNRRNQPVFLPQDSSYLPPGQEYSEATAAGLDAELRALLDQRQERVEGLLAEHRDELEQVAGRLLEDEVIDGEEFYRLLGLPEPGGGPDALRQVPPPNPAPMPTDER
jgi:cell division protease FtsH